jgi:hypothetical protein
VHNDAARLLDLEELVERIVALRRAGLDARSAQVIVCSRNQEQCYITLKRKLTGTVEALVPNTFHDVVAHVADDTAVNDGRGRWRGSSRNLRHRWHGEGREWSGGCGGRSAGEFVRGNEGGDL